MNAALPSAAPVDHGRPVPDWLIDMFAAADRFDVDTFLTFLTPDCEFRFGNAPAIYGHAAIGAALTALFNSVKGVTHTDLEAWVHPDATTCSGTVIYVRLDDLQVTFPFAAILRLDHTLIRQFLIFVDNSPLFA